jgi:NhaP-type Na+/H+ or K+/H+ antiporter
LWGWFGPRGLASVVFALLAREQVGESGAGSAITVIAFTVLLSVLGHGATADPLARRCGRPWRGHWAPAAQRSHRCPSAGSTAVLPDHPDLMTPAV